MKCTIALTAIFMFASCNNQKKEAEPQEETTTQNQSTRYNPDSGYTTGTTLNNKKNGWWKSFNQHGQLVAEELYDATEHVLRERLVTNAEISSERMITQHGELVVTYHPNGRMASYGYYKADSIDTNRTLTGDSRQFDKNGILRLYSNFNEKTRLVSETEYDYTGQLLEERFYIYINQTTKKNTGTWKKYKNGKLIETVKQKNSYTIVN